MTGFGYGRSGWHQQRSLEVAVVDHHRGAGPRAARPEVVPLCLHVPAHARRVRVGIGAVARGHALDADAEGDLEGDRQVPAVVELIAVQEHTVQQQDRPQRRQLVRQVVRQVEALVGGEVMYCLAVAPRAAPLQGVQQLAAQPFQVERVEPEALSGVPATSVAVSPRVVEAVNRRADGHPTCRSQRLRELVGEGRLARAVHAVDRHAHPPGGYLGNAPCHTPQHQLAGTIHRHTVAPVRVVARSLTGRGS